VQQLPIENLPGVRLAVAAGQPGVGHAHHRRSPAAGRPYRKGRFAAGPTSLDIGTTSAVPRAGGIGISGGPRNCSAGHSAAHARPRLAHRVLRRWQRGRRILWLSGEYCSSGCCTPARGGLGCSVSPSRSNVASILDIAAAAVPSYRVRIAYAAGAMLILITADLLSGRLADRSVAWPQHSPCQCLRFSRRRGARKSFRLPMVRPQPGQVVHYNVAAENARES